MGNFVTKPPHNPDFVFWTHIVAAALRFGDEPVVSFYGLTSGIHMETINDRYRYGCTCFEKNELIVSVRDQVIIRSGGKPFLLFSLAKLESLEVVHEWHDGGIHWKPENELICLLNRGDGILDIRAVAGGARVHLGLFVKDAENLKIMLQAMAFSV